MKIFLGITEKNFGEVLRKYRNEHNFTQKKVADYLGIDRTTYCKYETVRKPELDVIMKLAALYNVSVDEFLRDFFSEKPEEVTPLALASAPCEKRTDELFTLDDDEKQLLLFYRDCIRKKDVLENARTVWLQDTQTNGNSAE